MSNNIKNDLDFFNELASLFLEDETLNPVSEYLPPHMYKRNT